MIVDGVDKYYVSELKRVSGSAEYDGEEFVFLYDPEQEDTTRAYRPDSFVMAVMMDDEIFDGTTSLPSGLSTTLTPNFFLKSKSFGTVCHTDNTAKRKTVFL